jgi:hypothetical protein
MHTAAAPVRTPHHLGRAWFLLTAALAVHVFDEASTGFLSVYNPTVAILRQRYAWFPMPQFEYRAWLTGLIAAVVLLLLLTPLATANVGLVRPLGYVFAVIMLLNGIGHTAGTIAGRSVASVHFARPMPGFYSSPFLIAAAIYLLIQLRRSA